MRGGQVRKNGDTGSRWRSGYFRWTDDSLDRERRITAAREISLSRLSVCQLRGEQPVLVAISLPTSPSCLAYLLPSLSPRVEETSLCYFRDRDVYQVRGRIHGRRLRVWLVERTYINIAKIINKYSWLEMNGKMRIKNHRTVINQSWKYVSK